MQTPLGPRLPCNPVANFLPPEHSQIHEVHTNPLRMNCRLQNHHPSCKPPCLQASRLDASNHRVIEFWRFQDRKLLIGPRLPSNPGTSDAIRCHRPPNFLPQNTPKSQKSTQIHLESNHPVIEIWRFQDQKLLVRPRLPSNPLPSDAIRLPQAA